MEIKNVVIAYEASQNKMLEKISLLRNVAIFRKYSLLNKFKEDKRMFCSLESLLPNREVRGVGKYVNLMIIMILYVEKDIASGVIK